MTEENEAKGTFKYEQDSKRFHRYTLEADGGIVGMIYFPKDTTIPEAVTLKRKDRGKAGD
ncbi:MAG: hypothetical protein CVU61_09530 [Deltaproteobacteria bacterium HGW-Deltaproteobacteria-19]|jgi:hypothetical protein|nr:MAG: hypothetical protein CVU61_09530 [Deltaproteobacteria bacterium HGW-Deltaproteobacteria-19]